MPNLYIARQPIYDRKLEVYAYELLYRAGDDNQAPEGLGDQATNTVIINALSEIGLDELVGSAYAFINLTRGFIVGDSPWPFTRDQVVVEVLEDIVAEPKVIEGVKHLASLGHKIALDDFVYDDSQRDLVYYNISLGYNILPGESFFGGTRAFNSALYLVAGVGNTEFADDSHFTINVGAGYRFLINDWMALHLDFKDHIFDSDLLGTDKTTHNLEGTAGFTLFF